MCIVRWITYIDILHSRVRIVNTKYATGTHIVANPGLQAYRIHMVFATTDLELGLRKSTLRYL